MQYIFYGPIWLQFNTSCLLIINVSETIMFVLDIVWLSRGFSFICYKVGHHVFISNVSKILIKANHYSATSKASKCLACSRKLWYFLPYTIICFTWEIKNVLSNVMLPSNQIKYTLCPMLHHNLYTMVHTPQLVFLGFIED